MSEWKTIESAPKDGSRILLYTEYSGDEMVEPFSLVQIGYWHEGCDAPEIGLFREPEWELEKIGEPTHWMPLPEPPKGGDAT